MNHHYNDIRSRIPEPPTWFDENAVPRYEPFAPVATADIYAKEAVLLEIACQNCGHRFHVCMAHDGALDQVLRKRPPLREQITAGSIHYGDPPNVECCPAGPTMNCEDLRVLEYWHLPNVTEEWVRDPALEVVLPDGKEAGE